MLGGALITLQGQAQDALAPLFLNISGDGTVTPYQSGQLLTVGQNYELSETPAAGYVFSGWEQAYFFVFVEYTLDAEGQPLPPITSTVVSPIMGIYSDQPILDFTLMPEDVLYNVPGVAEITQDSGWQADFVAIPEPSSVLMMVVWLTIFGLFRWVCLFSGTSQSR